MAPVLFWVTSINIRTVDKLNIPSYLKDSRILNNLSVQRLLKYWAIVCIGAVIFLSLTALITNDILSSRQEVLEKHYLPLGNIVDNLEYIASEYELRIERLVTQQSSNQSLVTDNFDFLHHRTSEHLDLLVERTRNINQIHDLVNQVESQFEELVEHDIGLFEYITGDEKVRTAVLDDLLLKQKNHIRRIHITLRQLTRFFSDKLESFASNSYMLSQANLLLVMAVSLLVIFIIIAGISLLIYRINKPLTSLRSAMRDLSLGELSRRMLLDGKVNDEFAELSMDFNRFAERNQDLFEEVTSSRDALEKSEKHTRAILENALVGIAHVRGNYFMSANHKFEEIFGYPRSKIVTLTKDKLFINQEDFRDVDETMSALLARGDTYHSEIQLADSQNNSFWCAISAKSISSPDHKDDQIWMFEDITQRKQAEEELLKMANYDSLTGLPNRSLFRDRLQQGIGRTNRQSGMLGLLYIDLDYFKKVNDSFGHTVGDELLVKVAERINESVRNSDTACRLGGDEFTIILPEIQDISDAGKVSEKIVENMTDPFVIDGQEINITPSIGICIYPDNGRDIETLLKNADSAAYHAKAKGRNNYQYYTQAMNVEARNRLDKENRLRRAVENGNFVLYYQPQVNASDLRIVSYEALIRWNDPEHGIIPPIEFIPILEDTGLIVKVGEWIIQQACEDIPRIAAMNKHFQHLSVNLSARQFVDNAIVNKIMDIIEKSGTAPEKLVLEITETVMMTETQRSLEILTDMNARGLKLSLDDFGTGYSSMAYLKQFPIHFLKVDKTFVSDLELNESDRAICEAMIAMARQLDLDVIAEGVENMEQFNILHAKGCHLIQGYLFGKPQPLDELLCEVQPTPEIIRSRN